MNISVLSYTVTSNSTKPIHAPFELGQTLHVHSPDANVKWEGSHIYLYATERAFPGLHYDMYFRLVSSKLMSLRTGEH